MSRHRRPSSATQIGRVADYTHIAGNSSAAKKCPWARRGAGSELQAILNTCGASASQHRERAQAAPLRDPSGRSAGAGSSSMNGIRPLSQIAAFKGWPIRQRSATERFLAQAPNTGLNKRRPESRTRTGRVTAAPTSSRKSTLRRHGLASPAPAPRRFVFHDAPRCPRSRPENIAGGHERRSSGNGDSPILDLL